ncbi:MAG: inositol monophosphatase [Chitinophagales bacterium]|nr:inositol monophosphatase [Chitinophagales bacterium]
MIDNNFIQKVIAVAEKAARFIDSSHGKVKTGEIVVKDLNSLVSYVDIESEKMIVDGLQALLPQSSFLTEEGTVEQKQSEWMWIIDPLDGTTNFLHQIPVYAVSIALQHHQETVFGLVYEVNRQECFYATKGQGAYLNGERLEVLSVKQADSLIATGFPYYDFSKSKAYLEVLEGLIHSSRGVRRLGAASVDLAYVAMNKFAGFYEYSLAPWDVAAGAFIIQEAGGVVTDFKGGWDWLYGKTIVAGNPIVHASVLELIRGKGL